MMKKLREEQQKEDQSPNGSSQKKGEEVVYYHDVPPVYSTDFYAEKISYLTFDKGILLYFHSRQLRPPIAA